MENHFTLTIKDILTRKHFENIEILAGKNGIDRIVKWVHVVDVIEVGDLLNGGELILSTGFAWKDDEDLLLSLLQQLIECNAAGMCIERAKYITEISRKAVEFADQHNFPIILFQQEVPFVEITQDIHTLIISQHYQLISNLEDYSQRLNKKLLSMNSYFDILKFLQQYLKCQIVYMTDEGNLEFFPEVPSDEKHRLMLKINDRLTNGPSNPVVYQSVQVLEREYAKLFLIPDEREFGEFESLILDRTVTALAQHLLRELYTEEKRKAEETEWILEWLQGEHSDEKILEHLSLYQEKTEFSGVTVLLLKLRYIEKRNMNDRTYLNMFIQNIFDQRGFFVLPIEKRSHYIFILINKRQSEDWKARVEDGMKRLRKGDILNQQRFSSYHLAVGKYVEKLSSLNKSYLTALETLAIQEKLKDEKIKCFYEDLHMYRLIRLVHKHSDLSGFIKEYLQPILQYDEKNNTNLMETLRVYLECNGSKKETAKRIFVVRQTLYHRIEKLEKLLGKDFMSPEKRQVLEFSILAYEYLGSLHEVQQQQ